MKTGNALAYIWEGCYLFLVAVIVAYSWLGYRLDSLTPLPMALPVTIVVAPLCGALVYLFIKSMRRAFYACIIMCCMACLITMFFMLRPSFLGIGSFRFDFWIALQFTVLMALYIFPFGVGGCLSMNYLFPE